MENKEKIKEQRVSFTDLIKQEEPEEDSEPEADDFGTRFDRRAQVFWDELFGIIDLLNKANPKNSIQEITNPTISNYLLWRVLSEIKLLREDIKIQELNKEKIRAKLGI